MCMCERVRERERNKESEWEGRWGATGKREGRRERTGKWGKRKKNGKVSNKRDREQEGNETRKKGNRIKRKNVVHYERKKIRKIDWREKREEIKELLNKKMLLKKLPRSLEGDQPYFKPEISLSVTDLPLTSVENIIHFSKVKFWKYSYSKYSLILFLSVAIPWNKFCFSFPS